MVRDANGPVTFDAQSMVRAIQYAADWLGVYKEEVNSLNVYPVPDGDTGTNMHLTLQGVCRELEHCDATRMDSVARAISYGALLGARGNSGVILSQLLKGFSEELRNHTQLNSKGLIAALERAKVAGYAAVMKPVEGTILTVARGAAEAVRGSKALDVLSVLEMALEGAKKALATTPDLLPVLKQAGVVDSGGQGYVYILEGILAFFRGDALPKAPLVTAYAGEQFETEAFGYCTEFLLKDCTLPIEKIQDLVAPFGDSLLVVGSENFVKGHIHTNDPDRLLAAVAHYGTMVRSKVEDMGEQHTEILASAGATTEHIVETGLVAVATGEALIRLLRKLGARVVSGGQTQNPSVEDLVGAIQSVSAKKVIVLPNNKNIWMAAQKAVEWVGDRAVVLPTKTLGQGLCAALTFDPDVACESLQSEMAQMIETVITLEVTRASRSVQIGAFDIQEGQIIGLRDDELVCTGGTAESAVLQMIEGVWTPDREICTVFSGPSVTEADLEHLKSNIAQRFPRLELDVHVGGPELYDYLVVLG